MGQLSSSSATRNSHNSSDSTAIFDGEFGVVVKFLSYCFSDCSNRSQQHFCYHAAIAMHIASQFILEHTNNYRLYSTCTTLISKCIVINDICAMALPNNVERNL